MAGRDESLRTCSRGSGSLLPTLSNDTLSLCGLFESNVDLVMEVTRLDNVSLFVPRVVGDWEQTDDYLRRTVEDNHRRCWFVGSELRMYHLYTSQSGITSLLGWALKLPAKTTISERRFAFCSTLDSFPSK
ncbi:unnamed protein product [Trichobilharzia szidati]|nr:unnamed protein product [Trichobilharzia szidati]